MKQLIWAFYRLAVGFTTFAFLWWAFGLKLAIAFILVLWTIRLEFSNEP